MSEYVYSTAARVTSMTVRVQLAVATGLMVCAPLTTFAQALQKTPKFEVASVRQRRVPGFNTTGVGIVEITSSRASYRDITLKSLLMRAYNLEPFQVKGPVWLDSQRYDVLAVIPEGTPRDQVFVMLQHLLAERFGLKLRFAAQQVTGYSLKIGKGGAKLTLSDPAASPRQAPMSFTTANDSVILKLNGTTMPSFAGVLSRFLQLPVVDLTSLSGKFDIALSLARDDLQFGRSVNSDGSSESAGTGASFFTAVHALGLDLISDRVPLQSVVVEKAQRNPIEN